MAKLFPSSISKAPHIAAMEALVEKRFAGIDLTRLMVYLIDTVPAEALPSLANQFDVMGYKGMFLATNETEAREIIKNAITLHKYMGTPFAIKQALKSFGYGDVTIKEHVGVNYDGVYNYNGDIEYEGGDWWNFRVIIDVPAGKVITAGDVAKIETLIKVYKNVRSILTDVQFAVESFLDTQPVTDGNLLFNINNVIGDHIGTTTNYDGLASFDGSQTYQNIDDVIQLNVLSSSGTNSYTF